MAHHSSVVAVPSQTGTDYHFSALGGTTVMLAELVDHVIGVDPDKEWITTAIVDATTTGVVDTARFGANSAGYHEAAILWAEQHTTPGERVWAVEDSESFGRGLAARLASDDEWVVEFDWAREKARPNVKSSAASSATSPAASGGSSSTPHPANPPLDRHRSVALRAAIKRSTSRAAVTELRKGPCCSEFYPIGVA